MTNETQLSPPSPPSPLAPECRRRFIESVASVQSELQVLGAPEETPKLCLILSGGVDTCAILEAAVSLGITFAAAITVVIDGAGRDGVPRPVAPDEAFAIFAAKQHGLDHCHSIVRMTSDDLVSEYLPSTIKLLATWDGMTIRNSLVISAAFKEAKRLGMDHVVVGDGADELFGGYSFMWGSEDDVDLWKKKRNDMCRKWTFATNQIASSYGIRAHGPYMNESFVEWALNATERIDCIGERPIKLVLDGESIMHAVGKIVLREAFDTCASWRRKDPIEVGSGAPIISKNDFWSDQLSDEEYEKEKEALKVTEGIVINSKEYMINFRAYVEAFGGIRHPDKKRLSIGKGCAGCCFEIGNNTFCHICGAWPAQRLPAKG